MKWQTAVEGIGHAIRFKSSDGGVMIYVVEDNILWSLTLKYFKRIAPELKENYEDWVPMTLSAHSAYLALLQRAQEGKDTLDILGRQVTLISEIEKWKPPNSPRVEGERLEISDVALEAAGRVAEALGVTIKTYIEVDRSKADAAHQELMWIAKNVGWQTKSNRRRYEE